MTTISGASAVAGLGGVPMTSGPAGSMDQNDFLRLMTTQLTTQDPFNPIDNTQMVAQMAQFSQVAGIAEMNASLRALVAGGASGRLTDAANWIGRSVLVASDSAVPRADGSYAGEVALPESADSVILTLVDAQGAIVHRQEFGARAAGTIPFSWDGRDADGNPVAGPLTMSVDARAGGSAIAAATASLAQIAGIQSPASGTATRLMTGLGLLPVDSAIRLI